MRIGHLRQGAGAGNRASVSHCNRNRRELADSNTSSNPIAESDSVVSFHDGVADAGAESKSHAETGWKSPGAAEQESNSRAQSST
jgi:hypothetical protein